MNAYFACHAHAHALHLCSLTRSVQCFQQLRDDGVVEQSASQSGYGAAIKHCDQPAVLKLNPFLLRNQVAELSGVESFTNAQAQHDGLFDVLVGSDAFTAGPWHIALIDGGAPQSRMRDIPGAQSFAVFAIAIMRMRTGTETGPIDVPPIAKVVLRLVSRTSPIANLIPFEAIVSAISYLFASSSSSGLDNVPAAIRRPIFVFGAMVSAYAEIWLTPKSMAVRTDVRQSSRLSPGAP